MSLQVWLPLNGNLNNQGISNSHVISKTDSLNLSSSGGKISSYCAKFTNDSTQDYLTISDAGQIIDINSKQLSIAFWMKSTNTENQCLFCNRTDTGYGISIFKLNQTQLRFDTGNTGQTSFLCSTTYSNWTHFCFTWDGLVKTLYINI